MAWCATVRYATAHQAPIRPRPPLTLTHHTSAYVGDHLDAQSQIQASFAPHSPSIHISLARRTYLCLQH